MTSLRARTGPTHFFFAKFRELLALCFRVLVVTQVFLNVDRLASYETWNGSLCVFEAVCEPVTREAPRIEYAHCAVRLGVGDETYDICISK